MDTAPGPVSQLTALCHRTMTSALQSLSDWLGQPLELTAVHAGAGRAMALEERIRLEGFVTLSLELEGDVCGDLVLLLEHSTVQTLLMHLVSGTSTIQDPLGQSAIAEVGNLLVSGFVNGLAEMTGAHLVPTPPCVQEGGWSGEGVAEDRLRLEMEFADPSHEFFLGRLLFWPEPDGLYSLLGTSGK